MSNAATIVSRVALVVPSESQGGQQALGNPTTTAPTLTRVADWRTTDGTARRGTIVLAGRIDYTAADDLVGCAVVAKITFSSPRGQWVQWSGTPAFVPFAATTVTVEMMVVRTPMQFAVNSGIPLPFIVLPRWTGGESRIRTAFGSAIISDQWSEQPPPVQLCAAASLNNRSTQVNGPVYVSAAEITNTGTNPVQVLLTDGAAQGATLSSGHAAGCLIVPASSSVALGADLLGPYFQGLNAHVVLDLTAGAPAYGGIDATASALCFLSASGYPSQVGTVSV